MKVTRTGRWIYGTIQITLFLAIMAVALLVAGAGWLLLEPREVPFLTARVEQVMNRKDQPYTLTIGRSILSLGSFQHPLQLSFRDVSLNTPQGKMLARMPAMHVSLGLFSLLMGGVSPGKITLIEPSLSLRQDEEGRFYLEGESATDALPLYSLFAGGREAEMDSSALFDSGVEELEITAGRVAFQSDLTGMKVKVPAADITLRQYGGMFRGRFAVRALQEGRTDAALESYFRYEPETKQLVVRAEFKGLVPADYAEIVPELSVIEQIKLPLGGKMEIEATLPDRLHKASAYLTATAGSFAYAPYFPQEIAVEKILFGAELDGDRKKLTLNQFTLEMPQGRVSANGFWQRDFEGRDRIKGEAQVVDISKKIVMRLWPEMISPVTRNWVKTAISKAEIPRANFTINAPAGSLAAMPYPDEILKTVIEVEKAKVNYAPGFPLAEEASGTLTITGDKLKAELAQAKLLGASRLTAPGEVSIPSLGAEVMEINLKLPLVSDAVDVLTFLAATPYKMPEQLNLNTETIRATLQGEAKVKILDHTSPREDDVFFEVKADASDFTQPEFYKGMDVSGARGTIRATDRELEVEAEGKVDGRPMWLKTLLRKDSEYYNLRATLPVEELARHGVEVRPYVTGPVGVDLEWVEDATSGTMLDAKVDLTPSTMRIESIDYTKPAGDRASLLLQGEIAGETLTLDHFRLHLPGRKEEATGTAKIGMKTGEIREVNFAAFDFAGSQGKGTYRSIPGGHYLHAKGERLDLSFRDEGEEKENKKEAKKEEPEDWDIPALDLNLAFDEVQMAKDPEKKLNNLKLTANCDVKRCHSADLSANAGGSAPVSLKILRENGKRVLSAYTPRADIVLRAMNVFDDMQNGEMRILGVFEDSQPDNPLVGKVTIGPHRVKDVPWLTKLLTVATFTGIVDALSGDGLMFQKLEVPFRKVGMNVYLQEAKTAGPSIGITAEGTVDLARDEIDLRGTVIPAYMFNAVIRSIPLLGNVFGALAGDGLVAMRYSMQGALENPDVIVNPLSALTPGFLRNFFTIFETDTLKATQNPAEVEKALEKAGQELEQLEQKQKIENPPLTEEFIGPQLPEKRRRKKGLP